jgi:hypothetical protein
MDEAHTLIMTSNNTATRSDLANSRYAMTIAFCAWGSKRDAGIDCAKEEAEYNRLYDAHSAMARKLGAR